MTLFPSLHMTHLPTVYITYHYLNTYIYVITPIVQRI